MGLPAAVLLLSTTVSLLGGLIFGYELGIISGALLQLKNDFHLTCLQQEALVSAVLIGALFASLIGGFLIDRSGRRTSILASNMVVLAGSTVLILSTSFWSLVVGRVTIGFAISISSMACCIYVSEIVKPHQRGTLVSLYETGVTLGILLSYGMNYFLSGLHLGWKYMFGLAISPAIFQFISILFLPSKPPNVNMLDRESQNGMIPLNELQEAGDIKPISSIRDYSFLDLFRSKDNMRMRTLVGLGLVLFQQLTGQPNVLYYASTIFRSLGYQSNSSAVLASVGLGVVKVLSTLVAMSCADKAGRRVLLLAGCAMMTVSVTGIGIASFTINLNTHKGCESLTPINASSNSSVKLESLGDITTSFEAQHGVPVTRLEGSTALLFTKNATGPSSRSSAWTAYSTHSSSEQPESFSRNQRLPSHAGLTWITLLSLMAFVSAFSIGFGPMTWLVLSEIYPPEIRGRAFAFCNSLNWAANLLITLTFLDVIESIGLSWTFLLYGLMGAFAIIFIYYFIPETKGRSLEEIDKEFSDKSFFSGRRAWNNRGGECFSSHQYQRMGQSTTSDSSSSSCS
ncbi:PREDICTED: solute carrier family 2, facilitated glucose transporter member 10 [Nanorana parkeri]|uniref:solute carrier family 2, facilitated glucose transporter member 10 n=1 Tax=Nanorana parkeri TaxID=125878 RepID=UPI00085463CF|nr:PREDICTED: solute carrier family 2, facilitated glucose transporter member 10 [Nanorana parkeri]